ncbi:MAG: Protein TolB, partial [Pseudomonadota bacterium]
MLHMKLLSIRSNCLPWLLALPALLLWGLPAWAQFRVEVTGVGMTQLPVVVAPFKGEAQSPQKMAAIVQADLERSGQFKGLSAGSAQLDEVSRPDWSVWRQLSAEALLAGSVTRLADGRFDIRARLWDAVKGQEKADFRDTVVAADLRLSAHRIAD